ncbi:MAG TPA: STAS domain-containing protein [Burkholderiales bacterium]
MTLPHRSYGPARVVSPRGRLDHESCDAFQDDLAKQLAACKSEGASLVLDLSGVEYVSSAGLRCLMIAARQASSHNSRVVVAAPQPIVGEILQISRFNLVLPVFGTTREALASLSPEAAQAFDRG